jgi:hypothetical protein
MAPPIAIAPPVYAYGGFFVGPRPAVIPYYGARVYPGAPIRAYGYAPRPVVPGVGVRGYAYGYAGRAYAGGYTARGPMVASRAGMAFGGGARVR